MSGSALVALETATLAQKVGFNYKAPGYYQEGKLVFNDVKAMELLSRVSPLEEVKGIPAPLLQQLQWWLGVFHKIYIEVSVDQTTIPKFTSIVSIYRKDGWINLVDEFLYRNYGEALESGLLLGLNHLKNELGKT